MFKFIHAADIHLDSPLQRLGQYDDAPADLLRSATRHALSNLVDLAIDEQVDFVVIAGDVYDGDWDDVRTGLVMVQQMARLRDARIPVFVIAGNHDAATKMTHHVPLPDNVTMFGYRKPATETLEHLSVAIHGQSFSKQAVTENLARNYPPAVPNMFNLGLLHTSLDGREGHANYAPCSLEDLRAKQYDYWALGHIHQREQLSERPWIGFSGNLQGRHVREAGAKGALLVSVDDARASDVRVEVEFRELDVVRWERLELNATDFAAAEELHEAARTQLESLRAQRADLSYAVRLEVTGETPFHDDYAGQSKKWEVELRGIAAATGGSRGQGELWVEKIKFRTHPPRRGGGEHELSDGPLAEVESLVAEYLSSDEALAELGKELQDLRTKLPQELQQGGEPLLVDSPAFLRERANELAPYLREQLRRGGSAPLGGAPASSGSRGRKAADVGDADA